MSVQTATKTVGTLTTSALTVSKRGIQPAGRNIDKPYAMGTFQVTTAAGKVVTLAFKAFDEEFTGGARITPASALLALAEAGVATVCLTGGFLPGRPRDRADAAQGRFVAFKVAFVETLEAHDQHIQGCRRDGVVTDNFAFTDAEIEAIAAYAAL